MIKRTALRRLSKLKRTPLVRRATKSTKKPSSANFKPLRPLPKLKQDLWKLCKQIIRKRYGNTCYTCEAFPLEGSNWHTGHFIASSVCGMYLRFDLRNLRPQCYRCNISLSGNGAVFYENMREREGQDYVDSIFADKLREQKENRVFIQGLIDSYTEILCITSD